MTDKKLDQTGKAVFDDIYTAPDPRPYIARMASLGYSIPAVAQPAFEQLFADYQAAHSPATAEQPLHVLDLGSSYGINAALLRNQMPLPQLFERYDAHNTSIATLSSEQLLERDQHDFQNASKPHLHFTGLDISAPALHYAQQSGLLQASLCVNLEPDDAQLDAAQHASLQATNCVISSGCIGYITTKTLRKLLDAFQPQQPWMLHCILRMFPLDEYTQLFAEYGYKLTIAPEPVRQRRFDSAEEQAQVISRLQALGIDPAGYEDSGWLYAQLITVECSNHTY